MCRLLVVLGDSGRVKSLIDGAMEGLVRAASNDPIGNELYGEAKHRDGWGYLVVTSGGSGLLRVHHYRSLKPIFEEDAVEMVSRVVGEVASGEAVGVFVHARAASTGTPVNILSTHPVRYPTPLGELYMIHNGSFRRSDLANYLGLGDLVNSYNDTYIANMALAKRVSVDVGFDDLAWLLGYVKTGANLGVVHAQSSSASIIIGSYYRLLNDRDDVRDRYYRLYRCAVGGAVVYASSTIIEYYRPSELVNCTVVSNGEYHRYVLQEGSLKGTDSVLISREGQAP